MPALKARQACFASLIPVLMGLNLALNNMNLRKFCFLKPDLLYKYDMLRA